MKTRKKIWIGLGAALAAVLLIFFGCWVFFATRLDVKKITEVNQTVTIYDQQDRLVSSVYAKENRTKVSINQVPKHVQNAFIAIEDVRFYHHPGIDVRRIFGAFAANIQSGGKSEGASTLTQQLIKLSHLSNEKTYSRKIKEAFMALELERRYSKQEILEMYMNYVYFGNGAYGIETAAKKYFNCPASELTIAQGALLAGVLKSPSAYAPHTHLEKSIERRNLVLSQMKEYEFITQQEYDTALKEPVNLHDSENEIYPHGYYVDAVMDEAEEVMGMDYEELLKEGYAVYTYMDEQAQNALEETAKSDTAADANGEQPEFAGVVLSPKSGGITALMGGREHLARRGLNRATAVKRSPGSTIKPVLVFAPAMEQNNYTAATLVLDERQDFGNYNPQNANDQYSGWVTVRQALTNSLNVPAVRTLQSIGVKQAKEYAQKVGIPFEATDDHLALALGGFSKGVTPLQIAGAYLPFANDGNYIAPTAIRKIVDKEGRTVYQKSPQGQPVLSKENAFIMTSMLKDVIQKGTAQRLKSLGIPIAGKTGTANIADSKGNRDSWMVSYTTEEVAAFWSGYDDNRPLPSGNSIPTLLTQAYFSKIYTTEAPADFVKPDGVIEVKLDKNALMSQNRLLLANEHTPEAYTITEYFTLSTKPGAVTDAWKPPANVMDMTAGLNAQGYPVIRFRSGGRNVTYTIMRNGQAIHQAQGSDGVLSYTDTGAQENTAYEYYVVAVSGESTVTSKKISVQTKSFGASTTQATTTPAPSSQTTTTQKTTEQREQPPTTRRTQGTYHRH